MTQFTNTTFTPGMLVEVEQLGHTYRVIVQYVDTVGICGDATRKSDDPSMPHSTHFGRILFPWASVDSVLEVRA